MEHTTASGENRSELHSSGLASPVATPYPGDRASVYETLRLAGEYHNAAIALIEQGKKLGGGLSYAPARLCAIQSIELYRNAVLRHIGDTPGEVRARGHDLADRAFITVLGLKQKTAAHLQVLSENREYLISRYGPDMTDVHTELNRLTATLREVEKKALAHIEPDRAK